MDEDRSRRDPAAAPRRERLAAERARVQARLATLTRDLDDIVASAAEANTDDEHDPEGATIGFERAQVTALREQALTRLAELDAAEQRLDEDAAPSCERCGREIDPERLQARPATRWCRDCAD